MTRPATTVTDVAWFNYVFETDLVCALGHPPGAHPLYVGMSSRPDLRYGQHDDAPWRRYASGWRVYPERYATEADALDAEKARIRASLPLANREHNWDNPCRLDFGAVPVGRRPRRTGVQPRRRPARRRWSRRARRRAWLAGAWLFLAVALALWCLLAAHVGLGDSALVGTGGATALFAAVMRRRGRRRYRRR